MAPPTPASEPSDGPTPQEGEANSFPGEELVTKLMPPVGYEDMTQMENMTEDTLLENIKLRYDHDLIYVTHLLCLN